MAVSGKDVDEQQVIASERITVALVAKAAEELRRVQARTGLSKTDVVNRAISAYDFIDTQLASGNEVIIRRKDTGQEQLVHFL